MSSICTNLLTLFTTFTLTYQINVKKYFKRESGHFLRISKTKKFKSFIESDKG